MLLLHLRTKDNYEASCRPLPLKALAKRYDVDVDLIGRILREFDLFEVDEERQMFRAPYLDRVMAKLEERRMINVENGKKGGRPKRMESTPETPMDKGEKPNQNQKSREEERRVTTVVKDNNSSNEEKTEKERARIQKENELIKRTERYKKKKSKKRLTPTFKPDALAIGRRRCWPPVFPSR